MKIAIISTACYRKFGGVAQETWQTALEFTQLGHTVHLITPLDYLEEYQFPQSDIIVHRVRIYKLSISEYKGIDIHVSPMRQLLTFPKLLAYVIKVTIILKHIEPDIVQTKGIMDAIPAYFAKCLFKTPYTLTIHGDPSYENSNQLGILSLSNITKNLWSQFPQVKHADTLVSLTKPAHNSILELLHREAIVIPNGVDNSKFCPDISKRDIRTKNFDIVSVGTLSPEKGFEYAIKSMKIITKKIPQAHLTIIGDGPLHSEHVKLIKESYLQDSVTLTGNRPHREIAGFMQKSHVFLLSSVSEGMPIALLEAMACGLPIVSTPVSISPEIITRWKNGYIVPYRDPDGIAEAVIRIYANNEIDNLSERSLTVSQSYTWKSVAKQYISEFEKILAK